MKICARVSRRNGGVRSHETPARRDPRGADPHPRPGSRLLAVPSTAVTGLIVYAAPCGRPRTLVP
eukprot:6519587-Prymnesium_polylepis.2